MATLARSGRSMGAALVFLLGAAVFLNYVDRGAIGIAAPKMKDELGLSAETYGLVFSAFFWIYAPVQFFAGWLCDRFSVYKLMAGGILLWAASTFLMGFAGGFASLLVLRIMLGIGESISFPGSSKIIARHVPPERRGIANAAVAAGIAIGPAVGTLAGGLILGQWGWRAIFFVFGVATLLWLLPWQANRPRAAHHRPPRRGGPCAGRAVAVEMAVVVDVDRPRARQLLLLFPARLAALVPDQVARLLDRRDDAAGDARLRGPGRMRARLRPFLRLVDPLGPLRSRLPAVDDGRRASCSPPPRSSAWPSPIAR